MTRKKTGRKASRKATGSGADVGTETPVDPREPIESTAANLDATRKEIEGVLAKLERPAEPAAADLVDVLLHVIFGHEVPCGIAQEAVRRIDHEYVDRNEYRVTEAYEVEDLLEDLGIPDLFVRCQVAQQAVAQIYNDQNSIDLQYLREATVSERKNFFQRVPAIPPHAVRYLTHYLSFEEVVFSPRSTQRVQARLGFEPKTGDVDAFVDQVRGVLAPFGHIPLAVGPDPKGGRPVTEPVLCPACLLIRLAPAGR